MKDSLSSKWSKATSTRPASTQVSDMTTLTSIKNQTMSSSAPTPSSEVMFYDKSENGQIETITAYRCQHKTHKLPTKGGTRFADNVSFE